MEDIVKKKRSDEPKDSSLPTIFVIQQLTETKKYAGSEQSKYNVKGAEKIHVYNLQIDQHMYPGHSVSVALFLSAALGQST
eukprot:8545620-Ditylum_brightwellii.AAC.1